MKRYLRSVLSVLLLGVLTVTVLTSCGDCKHETTDWRVDIEPTCLMAGTRVKVCEDCGAELETEQFPGSHYYEDGMCVSCGVAQYDTRYLVYREITLNGEEGYEIIDMGNCSEFQLTIPALHNNKPVLAISSEAFRNKIKLKSVHIGQNVAVIGDLAFEGCENLKKVTFSDQSELTTFGSGVFTGCEQIERIEIPKGVTALSDGLFEDCLALTEVVVHDGLLSLGDDVFAGCTITPTLEENGIAYLGTEQNPYLILLELKDKTLGAVEVPAGTVIIAPYAFNGAALTSVSFPATLREICGFAFSACASLGTPSFPTSLVRIGKYAFSACTSLTSLTLPSGLTDIGTGAFRGATALSAVSVPDSVLRIGASVFLNCADSIYRTENGACYVGNAQNPYLVLVKTEPSVTAVTVNAATRVIADSALSGTAITSITIPASVITIGSGVFSNCNWLESIVFENTSGWLCASLYGGSDATAADVSVAADNATAMTGVHRLKYFFRAA